MAINRFQRSVLPFDLSAKFAHVGVPSIFFSETTWSLELKFHINTTYDNLTKIYEINSGHMTRMTVMPIFGKENFKNTSPVPEGG